jgi:hypothetical protein
VSIYMFILFSIIYIFVTPYPIGLIIMHQHRYSTRTLRLASREYIFSFPA